MKFKYIAAALVLAGATANVFAEDPEDLRIYINPGHGSWTSNDRPMQCVGHDPYKSSGTDTTQFFESNTDLIKGFGVLEKLIEMGFPFDRTLNQEGKLPDIGAAKDLEQNLVMSRVKNGPWNPVINDREKDNNPDWQDYNRDLLEIATEVEYNEFDMFISIHSNAASTSNVNYHLFMYRGRNEAKGGPAIPESVDMIKATHPFSFSNAHAQWSEKNVYINGDIDFMGGGSGSENKLGYYGYLGVLKHGCPGYLVEGFFHTHTPSMHRAMNWDVDMLEGYQYARGVAEYFELDERDATGEIYGIVRDAHSKFIHKCWTPVAGTDDVLMPLNNTKVYLWKDGQVVQEYLTDEWYNGAYVFMGLEPGTYQITLENEMYEEEDEPTEVTVEAGKTSYVKNYIQHIWYNGKPGEDVNYPNLVSRDVLPEVADEYASNMHYTDVEIPGLANYTPERMVWMKDKLYILGRNGESKTRIAVVDDQTGEVLTVIKGWDDMSDMAVTADGYVMGVTKTLSHSADKYVREGEVRGLLTVYYWDNDANGLPTGEPQKFLSTDASGEYYRAYVGESFLYSGRLDEGRLVLSCEQENSSHAMRNITLDVTDKAIVETIVSRPTKYYRADQGDEMRFTVSPIDRNQVLVLNDGTKNTMLEFDFEHTVNMPSSGSTPNSLGTHTLGAGFFKFADHAMMTFAAPGETGNTLCLYDISRGISEAKPIAVGDLTVASPAAKVLTTGYPVAVKDNDGNVVGGEFVLLMLRDNKLTRYTTGAVPSGVGSVVADAEGEASYFDLNGRAVSADQLQSGLYVRLLGGKAHKVVVK